MDIICKKMKWAIIAALYLLGVLHDTLANKVLFLAPNASPSHTNFFLGVAEALVDLNGDEVTMVMPFSRGKKFVREVVLPMDIYDIAPKNLIEAGKTGPFKSFFRAPAFCAEALATKEAQKVLREKYDVVILTVFMSDCFLPAIYQMGVPFIFASPTGLFGPWYGLAGNPHFTSIIPDAHAIGSDSPDISNGLPFKLRFLTTLSTLASHAMVDYYLLPKMESEMRSRGLYPPDTPSLVELRHNSSLFLINSIQTMESVAKPYVPNVIHAGGIHLKDVKPLPEDLEEWVQGAGEDGFIFFSLGSAISKPSDMPEEFRKLLVRVFGSLKQRVLWKWDLDTMDDLPSNVRLEKWLPQQDILGHKNLKLFFTHGGLHSTMESIFHGVPVVGLPVFADQHINLKEVVSQGWGQVINWEVDDETLKSVLEDVINNHIMRKEAQRRASFLQDQIMSPAERSAYWVSYVVRHKGAKHLRCPAINMPWWHLYNVDVWATIIAILLVCSYLSFKMMFACYRCCCGRTKKKVE